MSRQLNLDRDRLDHCYEIGALIASHAAKYIDRHSSPAVERATLILLGLEGHHRGMPVATSLVEQLTKDQLRLGAAYWWGRALLGLKEPASMTAEKIARGKIRWTELPEAPPQEIRKATFKMAEEGFHKMGRRSVSQPPHVVFRVQERKPKKIHAQVHELKKKGFEWTFVDWESRDYFKETWQPEELQHVWGALKDCNAVAATMGLSVPEQTLTALRMGFKAVCLDGWSPALEGLIDIRRALVDHAFSLSLCAQWPVLVLSNHARLVEKKPELNPFECLAWLALFEQMAARQGVALENIILSMAPPRFDRHRLLFEAVAFFQVQREMFSQSFLWCRLPGEPHPFEVWAAAFSEQDVVEFFAAGEKETQRSLEWLRQTAGLHEELALNTYGRIGREAHLLLEKTWKCLKQIQHETLWKRFESAQTGLGQEGVFQKSFHYWNPVSELLRKERR